MGRLVQQFMKFGVVGVVAFVIDYGLMVALTELAGVEYLISATISFTVSVVFNYLASMRYVFTHKEGLSRRREFAIFVVLSVIGLGINDLLMFLGTSLLGISYLITKIVATAVVMVYNFATRKRFLDAGAPACAPQNAADEADEAPGIRETSGARAACETAEARETAEAEPASARL